MSKFLKTIAPFVANFILAFVLVMPLLSQSQSGEYTNPTPGGQNNPAPGGSGKVINIENPFKCPSGSGANNKCTIPDFIEVIIRKILMPIGGVVAVLMVMWAGFLYVTAGGNETQIKKAHDALLSAVIGAAILLGAWAIASAIQATINDLSATS